MEFEEGLWSQLPFATSVTEFSFARLSQGCIRLVLIHRGSKHDDMECSLKIASLEACPAYEALSYVWGSNTQLETIQMDGHDFNVTPNLAEALRQLRGTIDRLIWIDQLCINQTDLDERSEQVPMMSQVYSKAQKVIVWLGADRDQEAPLAQGLVTDLYNNVRDKYKPGGEDGVRNILGGLAQVTDESLKGLNLPLKASPEWPSLSHLIELPYFERVWVVQEVHFATALVMYWGSTVINFPNLLTVLPWFVEVEGRAIFHNHLLNPETVSRVLDLKPSSRTFEQALSMTAHHYTKSLMEVYRYTTYNLLKGTLNMRCLAHIDNSDRFGDCSVDEFGDWPSWIPTNWHGVVSQTDITFHTCGENVLARVGAVMSLERSSMELKGFVQGKVQTVGMFASGGTTIASSNELETTVLKITQAWELMLQQDEIWRYKNFPPQDLNDPPLMAFLRTMLCGTEDLEFLMESKHLPTTEVHVFDSNRYLYFAQSWVTMLSAYLGIKGPAEVEQVEKSLSIAICGLADILGIRIPLQHDALEGPPVILRLRDDELREEFHSKVANSEYSGTMLALGRMRIDSEIFQASEGALDGRSPEISGIVDQLVDAVSVGWGRDNLFLRLWRQTGLQKRFFITENGFMGMGPKAMCEGDLTVVFAGGTVPFVIRPWGDGFRIIGSCYIEGIMGGELVEMLHAFDMLKKMVRMFKIV